MNTSTFAVFLLARSQLVRDLLLSSKHGAQSCFGVDNGLLNVGSIGRRRRIEQLLRGLFERERPGPASCLRCVLQHDPYRFVEEPPCLLVREAELHQPPMPGIDEGVRTRDDLYQRIDAAKRIRLTGSHAGESCAPSGRRSLRHRWGLYRRVKKAAALRRPLSALEERH